MASDEAHEMRRNGGRRRAEVLQPAERERIARQGGRTRAKQQTAEERSAAARHAARARWAKPRKNPTKGVTNRK